MVFKELHSLLTVRHYKLVWMCEIVILDPQARDSHKMRESLQGWHNIDWIQWSDSQHVEQAL